jgi:dienelactone hydrolase
MTSHNRIFVLQALICVALAISNFGCATSKSAPPILVAVSPASATVQANGTQPFMATVSNDSANMGVAWTVSCSTPPCGTVSSASTASGATTTYTAPPNSPQNSMTVSITATAVASSSANGQANITLPAAGPIQINASTDNSVVEPGGTAHFTANIANDFTNAGVNWTISCSPTPCGSVSPTNTQNNAATTYTAPPSTPPAGLTVTFTATSAADPTISNSGTITVLGVTVTVSAPTDTLQAGGTLPITATVANDATNSGVAWTLSCSPAPCGAISPSTTPSGTPATYSAPPTPPPSDLTVTVTATSLAYSGASASWNITVPAITVSVNYGSALIPLNQSQQFAATVANDPKKQGIGWSLTQAGTACTPACGTLSLATTASASPVTYSAPATLPTSDVVTLTASSLTDTTKVSTATITLSNATVQIVPYTLNFGTVLVKAKSSPRSVTLTTTGTAALSITGISITGTNSGDFSQTNTCNTSLGGGMSCVITAVFKPAAIGLRSASISIADSSTDSPQQISLSGTGFTIRAASVESVHSALANGGTLAVPIPTGPEPVGTRLLRFVDSARPDPYLRSGAKRELLVRFWYPASLIQACQKALYTSPRVWNYFSQLAGVRLPEVITNSCMDAPMAEGAHPVVVFTHGYTGTFTDYTFIFEDLASRGYVVASVDHTYEATAVEFPDGRFVKSMLGSHFGDTWRGDDATLSFAASVRLQDLKFVVTELKRLNTKVDGPFEGKLDVSRIAIAGHSMGGATAFLALEQDPRLRAAVVLDGYLPSAVIRPTQRPVFILRANNMNADADQCRLWNNLRGPRVLVNLNGSEHVTPSDAVWLAKFAIQTGTMGPERTVLAIRDYVAAFLDTNLLQRPTDPLLMGPSANYPDAVVVTKEQPMSCRP